MGGGRTEASRSAACNALYYTLGGHICQDKIFKVNLFEFAFIYGKKMVRYI